METSTLQKVSLSEKLGKIDRYWEPKIVAALNGQEVKVARLKGEFVWHHHEKEDELFLVLKGRLRLEFRDRAVSLDPGEMLVVPHGVEHRPVAEDEVELLLFEPADTLNTGNVVNERTVAAPERI